MDRKNRGVKKVKEVKSWRIATWNLQGGLLDPIKTIMVGDELTKNERDFVAFQEVQSKQERIQDLGRTS
jgi:exonuclease III